MNQFHVEKLLEITERDLDLSGGCLDLGKLKLSDFPILMSEETRPMREFMAYQCDARTLEFDQELLGPGFHEETVAHLVAMGVNERHLGVVCDHTGQPVAVYCRKDGGGYRLL